ncbi:hypothetical protein JOC77_001904 [Peribacillus deserti]|uniref:Uncharacterized protein n=1 Tax=Peribacillus deserti TaxID=673318 RepID=A0ABS2QI43_9BACI|nr:hypothetical protein [Peribacillus deserti]
MDYKQKERELGSYIGRLLRDFSPQKQMNTIHCYWRKDK